eukprot:CAMPEP_0172473418 /NCGR_PEP_ID=MMETSP1065-20121228/68844_1 /TAXON_ID=265537 /ORGANISM="Amphiprora paludosa, Strain CCMP125" /LENGTH=192 /DNA_ID=CAMNT_0013231593 /DNA_START=9 /DNA_END=587 /DNA_ORIENTATION=+
MSISDVSKLSKEVKSWFGLGGGTEIRKYGPPGTPQQEQACPHVNAYLTCVGLLRTEKKIFYLQPSDTVESARNRFQEARQKDGRDLRQQKILDEAGYELDPGTPLHKTSNKCHVNLLLTYSKRKELQKVVETTRQASESTVQLAGHVVEGTVGAVISSVKERAGIATKREGTQEADASKSTKSGDNQQKEKE